MRSGSGRSCRYSGSSPQRSRSRMRIRVAEVRLFVSRATRRTSPDRHAGDQEHAAHLVVRRHAHVGEHPQIGDALHLDRRDETDVEIPLRQQPRHQGRRMVARREQVRVMALEKPPGQRLAVQEVDDADAQLGQGLSASLLRHRVQELLVGLRLRELVEQELHRSRRSTAG